MLSNGNAYTFPLLVSYKNFALGISVIASIFGEIRESGKLKCRISFCVMIFFSCAFTEEKANSKNVSNGNCFMLMNLSSIYK